MSGKGITLYTAGTPNGWKANILVEELHIPYKVHAISLSKNQQKEDWYLKINPNGRIPAIGEACNVLTLVNLLCTLLKCTAHCTRQISSHAVSELCL